MWVLSKILNQGNIVDSKGMDVINDCVINLYIFFNLPTWNIPLELSFTLNENLKNI